MGAWLTLIQLSDSNYQVWLADAPELRCLKAFIERHYKCSRIYSVGSHTPEGIQPPSP